MNPLVQALSYLFPQQQSQPPQPARNPLVLPEFRGTPQQGRLGNLYFYSPLEQWQGATPQGDTSRIQGFLPFDRAGRDVPDGAIQLRPDPRGPL